MRCFPYLGVVLICLGIHSCYKEELLPAHEEMVFELEVSPEMQEFIYTSQDTSYAIYEPGMKLSLNQEPLDLDEIKTRGHNALNYRRKSYSVHLNQSVTLSGINSQDSRQLSRFKLISMAMDYTYIEERIGYGLLEKHDIMPLFYRYVELRINGSTQGIYLLVEDPEEYFRKQGSEYILRRGYYNGIEDSEYKPSLYQIPRDIYETRFLSLYENLPSLHGEELYEFLNQRMDLELYFRKMGLDYLLKNGDYTDEVYFYALIDQDQIRFRIIPWDYDDLFSANPHEVGRTWGTGQLFGDRYYPTWQDILNEIGTRLIYSIEDDLDYIIAMDPYLYDRYQDCLAALIQNMDPGDLDELFEQVRRELLPYYYRPEIISQSGFDQQETSYKIWEQNMEDKRNLLKNRLETMKEELKNIQP
jgi:spore coat protein H